VQVFEVRPCLTTNAVTLGTDRLMVKMRCASSQTGGNGLSSGFEGLTAAVPKT